MTDKTKIKKIDEALSKVKSRLNSINRLNNPTTMSQEKNRIELFLDACDIMQIAHGDFLAIKNENERSKKYETQLLVEYDYKLSDYADRCYLGADQTLSIFAFAKEYIQRGKTPEEREERKRRTDNLAKIPIEFIVLLDQFRTKMLEISARWHIRRVIELWDNIRPEKQKKLPCRIPLLKHAMFYYDRLLSTKMGIEQEDGIMPKALLFSTQPSSGKTYVANVYTVLSLILHQLYFRESGLIRLTNTQTNAYMYGSQVKSMMKNPLIVKVFPEWEKYIKFNGEINPFKIDNQESFLLKDCNDEIQNSIFMLSSGTSVNGKRAMCSIIVDDLSGGMQDMYNDELHRKQTDFVMGDIADRSDNADDMPMVYQGTFYNEYDVPNSVFELWQDEYDLSLVKKENSTSIYATPNWKYVAILVDCFDENMQSVAPKLISTEKLLAKQRYYEKDNKGFVFNLIYRQHKDSRLPKTFGYEYITSYDDDDLPDDLSPASWASLDPTRRAERNFFSMPILKYSPSTEKYYLMDAVYEQKSLGKVADPQNEFKNKVIDKIVDNRVTNLYLENNVSNTLSDVLEIEMKNRGYTICNIEEVYTAKQGKVSNKLSRILEQSSTIINNVVFPSKKYLALHREKKDLARFMDGLTNWNSQAKQNDNNPDDHCDSLAMFSAKYIFPMVGSKYAKILDPFGGINPLRQRFF